MTIQLTVDSTNCLAYNISAWITQKIPFLCCCLQLFPCKHACLRSCYSVTAVVYFLIWWSLLSNRSTCHTAPSLRLFIPNILQAYRHFFFSKGCACDVCNQPSLPSLWLISHGDYSPTAPSLRPVLPSGSLTMCELVQVYHHHLCSFLTGVGKSSESSQCSKTSGS
jgi:hypothetical protein